MTVLTVGQSPYLLTRNGRINRTILKALKDAKVRCGSLVWQHDIEYFLPNEVGIHNFDIDGKMVCRLFPYLGYKGGLGEFAIEVFRSVQPNVVVSISDYAETTFLASIKSRYRNLFKWVAILPYGSQPFNELYRYDLEYADAIICTNQHSRDELRGIVQAPVEYIPFGPEEVFSPQGEPQKGFGVIFNCKNDQMSNIPAFLSALKDSGVRGGLHYNHSDEGAWDIALLQRRFGLDELRLPQKYVSLREGIEDGSLNEEYNRYHAVVDCSSQSATGLSMLEAMATGCIPIGIENGAVGEIINRLPEEFRFFAPYEVMIGPREEEHAVVSPKGLAEVFSLAESKSVEPAWLAAARQKSRAVAQLFSKDKFADRVNNILQDVIQSEHAIVVDSF